MKVVVKFSWGCNVLIDAKDLNALAAILDGAPVVDYEYVGERRVDYIKHRGFALNFGPADEYMDEAELEVLMEQANRKEVVEDTSSQNPYANIGDEDDESIVDVNVTSE